MENPVPAIAELLWQKDPDSATPFRKKACWSVHSQAGHPQSDLSAFQGPRCQFAIIPLTPIRLPVYATSHFHQNPSPNQQCSGPKPDRMISHHLICNDSKFRTFSSPGCEQNYRRWPQGRGRRSATGPTLHFSTSHCLGTTLSC
jgi:hypothetical protein